MLLRDDRTSIFKNKLYISKYSEYLKDTFLQANWYTTAKNKKETKRIICVQSLSYTPVNKPVI